MSAILTFLADHGYAWVKRMTYFAVMMALATVFVVPYLDNLKLVMMWFLNISFFKVMTEEAIIFTNQIFIYAVTFKILLWFFASPQRDPSDTEGGSKSFSSRKS